jgi:hypothetical protein
VHPSHRLLPFQFHAKHTAQVRRPKSALQQMRGRQSPIVHHGKHACVGTLFRLVPTMSTTTGQSREGAKTSFGRRTSLASSAFPHQDYHARNHRAPSCLTRGRCSKNFNLWALDHHRGTPFVGVCLQDPLWKHARLRDQGFVPMFVTNTAHLQQYYAHETDVLDGTRLSIKLPGKKIITHGIHGTNTDLCPTG